MAFLFSDVDREIEIHNYSAFTGEYLNTGNINIMAHTGLPAHSTHKKPPSKKEGEVAIFVSDNWEIVTDHRGTVWDLATKEKSELTELGEVPEGKTKLQPSEFSQWSDGKWVVDSNAKLLAAQNEAVRKILIFSTECRRSIAGNPDYLETAEWSEKRLRALRVVNNTPLAGDLKKLETEALFRDKGETGQALAVKIAAKADRFEHASIVITGMTSAAIRLVNIANKNEELELLLESLKTKAEVELAKLQS